MLRPVKHLRPAMEAIAFQSGAFFKELKMLFEPFCNKGVAPSKTDLAVLAGNLDRAIANNVGVNAAIQFEFHGSCMFPPDILANNILLGEWRSFFSSKDGISLSAREGVDKIFGTVNLQKSQLTGFLSKIPVKIVLDIEHFTTDNMSPGEIAAVLLHEIGHYFSYCEMLTRTMTTNQVLAGVEQVMRGGDTKEYQLVLKKAVEELDLEKTVIENLKDSTDEKVVLTILMTETARKHRSSNTGVYDVVTWEMASDQFAARHGAGRDMAVALDKLMKRYSVSVRRNLTVHCLLQCLKVVFYVTKIIIGTVAILTGIAVIGGLVVIAGMAIAIYGEVDYGIQGTYDKPKQRLARIRQQLVELTKTPGISSKLAQSVLQDIAMIDGLMAEYTQYESWFSIALRKLIAPIGRKYDDVKFQQELEALAANSLFVKSLELKHA